MKKIFVCLAKSIRDGAFCIAGKEILPDGHIGKWFRPVGRKKEAIDNFPYDIGDIVSCDVDEYAPIFSQPENFILSESPNWEKKGVFENFKLLVDSPPLLWNIGNHSVNGTNDRVEEGCEIFSSLNFIYLSKSTFSKESHYYNGVSEIKPRLIFIYNGNNYSLRITCPKLSSLYWKSLNPDESLDLGPSYFTISLAKPWQGYSYKLVAGHVKI